MSTVHLHGEQIPATAFACLSIVAIEVFQWNRHTWDVDPSLITPSLQIGYVVDLGSYHVKVEQLLRRVTIFSLSSQIIFDVSTSLTKLSMLALLYRFAKAAESRMKLWVKVVGGIISLNCILFVFITVFQCR
jgi:hypothetical protein